MRLAQEGLTPTPRQAPIDRQLEHDDCLLAMTSIAQVGVVSPMSEPIKVPSKRHAGGIDGDQIYDLPQEPQPAAAEHGRVAGSASPKRLNPSCRGRSRLPTVGVEAAESQTVIRPNSKKLLGKIVPSDSERTRLFPEAAITKPLLRPTSTQWATTEDAVKAIQNGVSTATLGKLGAFRFQASPEGRTSSLSREADSHSPELVPSIAYGRTGLVDVYDFDEGLKDEDFLDIDQDRDVGHRLKPANLSDNERRPSFRDQSILASRDADAHAMKRQKVTKRSLADDEFPMDEEDEKEMMQLSWLNEPTDFQRSEDNPLPPFARPAFPTRVPDGSPVPGVTADTVLRTCFRIGEALRAGATCDGTGQDAVVELFARVKSSSREDGTTKQHFELADLFHDRPPFVSGVLDEHRASRLQATESAQLLGHDAQGRMVRCLGRLKRGPHGWCITMINIRATHWAEIRRTKQTAGAGRRKADGESQMLV